MCPTAAAAKDLRDFKRGIATKARAAHPRARSRFDFRNSHDAVRYESFSARRKARAWASSRSPKSRRHRANIKARLRNLRGSGVVVMLPARLR